MARKSGGLGMFMIPFKMAGSVGSAVAQAGKQTRKRKGRKKTSWVMKALGFGPKRRKSSKRKAR